MPPRYAYWTILVDNQPTAFRSAMQEDLMPTFKRLKQKHPSAEMKWFQNGKLWDSRTDAQEAMLVRGERGRAGDARQGGFRDRKHSSRPQDLKTSRPQGRPEWKPKGSGFAPERREKLDWKPKGEFTPAPKRADRPARPEWKPKGSGFDRERKPEWKPKREGGKPEWKPKGSFDRERKPDWKPKGSFDRTRKPEWKPRSENREPEPNRTRPGTRNPEPGTTPKRKWIPKEEYKRSKGISTPRDSKWRPGGEHKDPRQKYKDAKKAKWTRFKKTVRTRWESKKKKS